MDQLKNAVDALRALTLEEVRDYLAVVEDRLESMDNEQNRKYFSGGPFDEMVQHSNFKTCLAETKEITGVDVEFEDLDIEFNVTHDNMTITLFVNINNENMMYSWGLMGSPTEYEMYDSSYDNNSKTQHPVPQQILDYALFIWGRFITVKI